MCLQLVSKEQGELSEIVVHGTLVLHSPAKDNLLVFPQTIVKRCHWIAPCHVQETAIQPQVQQINNH